MHIDADITLGCDRGRSRVDAHADAHGTPCQCQLCRACGSDRVMSIRERDEERIPLRIYFDAVMFGNRGPKSAAMIGEDLHVAVPEFVEQPS